MKNFLNIVFYALLLAMAMVYLFPDSVRAVEASHCVSTGVRTTCFITNTATGTTTRITTTRIKGLVEVQVNRGTYSATETTLVHGKAAMTSGRDNRGNRWAITSVGTISSSGPTVAESVSIADTTSIQN